MNSSTSHAQTPVPAQTANRRALVLAAIGVGCVNAVLVFFSTGQTQLKTLAAVALAVYLLLAALAWWRKAMGLSSHLLIVLNFALLADLAWHSGGINSPAVIGLPALSIAALLLLDLRWAILWVGIALAHNGFQYFAVQEQWISAEVNHTSLPGLYAYLLRLNILFFLFLTLGNYESIFRKTRRQLELDNAALEALQTARHKAQQHVDALILSLDQHLRAPIKKIGALHNIMDFPAAVRPASRQIQGVTQRVSQVVNHVLAIAQVETGRLQLEHAPFNLYQALHGVFEDHDQAAAEAPTPATWAHTPDAALWVLGDCARFAQVVKQLWLQARGQAGQALQVRAEMVDGQVHVVFQRTSEGPLAAPWPDGASMRPQGSAHTSTLEADWEHALCERLMGLAGATWGIERISSGALQWWLRWPAQVCPAPSPGAKAVATLPQKSWHFLLVDEDIAHIQAMQNALRARWPDCRLGQAHSGESALLQLEFSHYDAVLMAVHMQPVDGLETVRRIRLHSKEQVRDVLIIGLCAREFGHQRQRYLQAGLQWVLFRPAPAQHVAQVLAALLAQEAPT